MKCISKGDPPQELRDYRASAPDATWEEMRGDAQRNGQAVYDACRKTLIEQQGGLCAYCEIGIRDNDPLKCRVEHFHPKADRRPGQRNWALDWDNMLGVCAGGSYRHAPAPYALEPLASNLSCDARKDQLIQAGRLKIDDGWILSPMTIVAFPSLFKFSHSTGELSPNPGGCEALEENVPNLHPTTEELVQNTIDMLGLNCDRLCQARLTISRHLEREKKRLRELKISPSDGLARLAAQYLGDRWHAFFTTVRYCLGNAAEGQLHALGYKG